MTPHVTVLGGGVAGMSAAHELIERGFQVTVYDKNTIAGGKARSFGFDNTGTDGRQPLPAEHGFRFFPGFYRHLPDTMKRIPYKTNPEGVFDNLVHATEMLIQFEGKEHLVVPSRFPRSFKEVSDVLNASGYLTTKVGLTPADIEFYSERVWQLLTSCDERRAADLEGKRWWDYIDADHPARSQKYRDYLARTPRVLVAADPRKANTKTVGDILVQLLFNVLDPGVAADRVLNGPTNEVWIDPWLAHLRSEGVTYEHGAEVVGFDLDQKGVAGVRIRQGGQVQVKVADYYIAALPVEKMAKLLTPAMTTLDPTLKGIATLAGHVDWMTGIQFYLREEVPNACGHHMLLGTPWALTSISQAQFWGGTAAFKRKYGDGTVVTVLSVDVSDWKHGVGSNGKRAIDCTRDEVAEEVWKQLKASLPNLKDEHLHPGTPWLLDPAITEEPGPHGLLKNDEELLVNERDSWVLRPWARTRIPNLFLASDYVRTHTNLATMEAANEAARRAVNAIIDASGSGAEPCRIWELHESLWVKPWRWWDLIRLRRGEPWGAAFPDFVESLAKAVLEGAPSIGGADEYADAAARAVIENGIGIVPTEVREEAVDIMLDAVSALERGDVDKLATFFGHNPKIRLLGHPAASGALFDTLAAFLHDDGHIAVDIRSLKDIRPSGNVFVARFAASVEALSGVHVVHRDSGYVDISLRRRQHPRFAGVHTGRWVIRVLDYVSMSTDG